MADTLIIEKAIEEIRERNFGLTTQFLDIHELVIEHNQPKVARVDTDNVDGTAIVYFPVKDEKFFLAIYIDTKPETSVRWVETEPYTSVYFYVSSDSMSLEELSQMTMLNATKGRNKGEPRNPSGNKGATWQRSSLMFEPDPGPNAFENKLKKLLDYLEQDQSGIKRLVDELDGSVQVAMEFHNGNTMLGGPNLDKESIHRLNALNLTIDFDLYVGGRPFQ